MLFIFIFVFIYLFGLNNRINFIEYIYKLFIGCHGVIRAKINSLSFEIRSDGYTSFNMFHLMRKDCPVTTKKFPSIVGRKILEKKDSGLEDLDEDIFLSTSKINIKVCLIWNYAVLQN